jgi:hypothetical protein
MTGFLRLARHRLEDGTCDLLGKEIIERVAATELDSDANEAILAGIGAHALNRYLPGEILHGLQVFTATGWHALLLSNLPRQEFPPTPITGFGAETDLAATNALHFGLIQLIRATPFAVSYENGGRLIRNVVPNPEASGTTSSWGADSDFFWHTDNPHQPFGDPGLDPRLYVPRYLAFYVVRNDERVPTEVAAVEDVVAGLSEETRRLLESAQYSVSAPASNDADPTGTRQVLDDAVVLELSPDGHYWARYDHSTTQGRTDEARGALDVWSAALGESASQEFMLEPGDFLIFDNYRVLHRRRAFTPGPDAAARWLRRCYAS